MFIALTCVVESNIIAFIISLILIEFHFKLKLAHLQYKLSQSFDWDKNRQDLAFNLFIYLRFILRTGVYGVKDVTITEIGFDFTWFKSNTYFKLCFFCFLTRCLW